MRKVLILLLFGTMTFAQQVNIGQLTKLTNSEEGSYYYPVFGPEGNKVFFTSEQYTGISYLNLEDGEITRLNSVQGAGYNFSIIENGSNVLYRRDQYKGMKKYSDLILQGLKTKESRVLEEEIRSLSMPARLEREKALYLTNGELKSYNTTEMRVNKASGSETYVKAEGKSIDLYEGNSKQMIQPAGKGHYIWTSLSPDKSKLLFTLAGRSTYVYDLNNEKLVDLGEARAPKWLPDGEWIVYMKDKDDGHKTTASDIFIKNIATKQEVRLTDTEDAIEMYPSWSPGKERVVFNSIKGEIYSLELNFE